MSRAGIDGVSTEALQAIFDPKEFEPLCLAGRMATFDAIRIRFCHIASEDPILPVNVAAKVCAAQRIRRDAWSAG